MKTTRRPSASWGAFGPMLVAAAAIAADATTEPVRQPVVPLEQVMDLDPDERRAFFDVQLAIHCGACHSSEMIEQQRLTPAQWQGEVKKMLGWGATLPEEYASAVAEHLAALHPPEAKPVPPTITPAEASALAVHPKASVAPAAVAAAAPLYAKHCGNCHGPEGHGGAHGPRLVGRAAIAHDAPYHAIIAAGRGGMPAFRDTIPEPDAEAIRQWLLARSFSWE